MSTADCHATPKFRAMLLEDVDDVVTIELRAVAGATYPLVNSSFQPDDAVTQIEDGTFNNPGRDLLDQFPYIGLPYSGYDVPAAS